MKKRILIADDEPGVRRLIGRVLTGEGYEVTAVSNGQEAVHAAAEQRPDMILLDVRMPEIDGWDALRALREDVRTRTIPVIMVTACGLMDDKVGALDLGADDYVTKPFAVAELRARVDSVLRRTQLALAANPLTRLPGSPAIEQEVIRRLQERAGFAFVYADINYFKSYNDAYGYDRGDGVIRRAADILSEQARIHEPRCFVGHVGGDDFVLLAESASAALLAEAIARVFDESVPSWYDPEHRQRGFVETVSRDGRPSRSPMISLSMGIATASPGTPDAYGRLVASASEMKAYCKRQPRRLSRFAFDRRRSGSFVGLDKS